MSVFVTFDCQAGKHNRVFT